MTFLRNIFRIIGITRYDVGYQAVDSVGDAIGSHDGIVAGHSSVGLGLVNKIMAENLRSGSFSIKKLRYARAKVLGNLSNFISVIGIIEAQTRQARQTKLVVMQGELLSAF